MKRMEGVVALAPLVVMTGFLLVSLRVTWKLAWRAAYAQGIEDGQQRGYVRGLDAGKKVAESHLGERVQVALASVKEGIPLRVFAQAQMEASRAGFSGRENALTRSKLVALKLVWQRRAAETH